MMTDKRAAAYLRQAALMIPRGPCGATDRKGYRRMADLIDLGDHAKALDYCSHMDTSSRERVPDNVIHYLRSKIAGGVRTITAHVRLKGTKKVFKNGFLPGVVVVIGLDFPKNISDDELTMAIVRTNDKILDRAVEVVYREGNKELCVVNLGES